MISRIWRAVAFGGVVGGAVGVATGSPLRGLELAALAALGVLVMSAGSDEASRGRLVGWLMIGVSAFLLIGVAWAELVTESDREHTVALTLAGSSIVMLLFGAVLLRRYRRERPSNARDGDGSS